MLLSFNYRYKYKARMKKIILIILTTTVLFSCSVSRLCDNYKTDENYFRASATVSSSNFSLAEERALFSVRQAIANEIDEYIKKQISINTGSSPDKKEQRIVSVRETVLTNSKVVCSQRSVHRRVNYAHVAIEVAKEDVENYMIKYIYEKK